MRRLRLLILLCSQIAKQDNLLASMFIVNTLVKSIIFKTDLFHVKYT